MNNNSKLKAISTLIIRKYTLNAVYKKQSATQLLRHAYHKPLDVYHKVIDAYHKPFDPYHKAIEAYHKPLDASQLILDG